MNYAKALAQVAATVLGALVVIMIGGHHPTPVEWTNVAIAGVGACSVFVGPNTPGSLYTKFILSILSAVLAFIATVIVPCASFASCHIPTEDWLQMIVIALGSVGVWAIPNKPPIEGAR